jgi:hypothetical protein
VDLIGKGEGFALHVFDMLLVGAQGGLCFPNIVSLVHRSYFDQSNHFLSPLFLRLCTRNLWQTRAYSVTQCSRRVGNQYFSAKLAGV